MIRSDSVLLSYNSYNWPVRSVEQLPPYTPAKLKIPVLVIGNTVRVSSLRVDLSHNLTFTIPRLTQSPRSLARKRQQTSLATMHSLLSNLASVTRPSLSPLLVLLVSWPITLRTLRLVVSLLLRTSREFRD